MVVRLKKIFFYLNRETQINGPMNIVWSILCDIDMHCMCMKIYPLVLDN